MSNPYFKFKQFTVYHNLCAMKVGTDGVLLGAWAALDVNNRSALDVGTGTGLIALMLAQRYNNLNVHAIDPDDGAICQANENFKNSPFYDRLSCDKKSLQDFATNSNVKFDCIVSNPPFFAHSLKSPDKQRSLARHTDALPVEDLICNAANLLTDNGKLSLIYPSDYKEVLFSLASQKNLSISRLTNVFPTPTSVCKRILIELSKEKSELIENNLIIEKERHVYTDAFIRLVHAFYLNL